MYGYSHLLYAKIWASLGVPAPLEVAGNLRSPKAPLWTFDMKNRNHSAMGCRLVTGRYVLGVLYRENRAKSENWPTLTPRSSGTVRRREKLTDLGNSLAAELQYGVHSISLQGIP